jgi:hypothetical protein
MRRIIAVLFCLATICTASVRAQSSFNQLASDNFVRANQNPLSGNWSRALGITADAQIVSNMVEVSSGPNLTATDYYNAVSWPNDQYSEIVAQADSAGSTGNMMAAVRMSTTDNTMYYGGATNGSFGTSVFQIKKRVAGTITSFVSTTHVYAAGDVIRLAVQGTALTLYLNGVSILTATDSSIASGRAGFMIQTDANLADVRFNNWTGGSITGSGPKIYITQSGSPSGACTTGVQSAAWFNTAANWGTSSGQIGPGTTVHICGTISSTLTFQGSGTSGNPITMFFETGGKISQTYCGAGGGNSCLDFSNKSWITIDGGVPCGVNSTGAPIAESVCNGAVEATANGTTLANQNGDNSGITAGFSSNIEIRNLDVRNIYVRTSTTDSHPAAQNGERPYAVDIGSASNVSIHDGKAHDANWSIASIQCSGNVSNISIYNEDTYNDNHGIAAGVCANSASGITVYNDHFGSMVNWDDTSGSNQYHHDGIHLYVVQTGGSFTGVSIYDSTFDGNWGVTNTSHIFFEGPVSGKIFNNLFFAAVGQYLSNGSINNCNSPAGTKNIGFYNNTLIYQTTSTGTPVELCGTVDARNNAITLAQTNNASIFAYSGTGTVDYNAYASPVPTTTLFSATGTCCQWTYATWQGTGHLNDTHSPAIQSPTMGLNTTTGVPASGSVLIGAGTNLTSLGITALNVDKAGNARPASGTWTIGALN